MSEQRSCPTCGAPLDGGAPDGLCAACLFGVGIVPEEADDPGEVDLIAEQAGDQVERYTLLEKVGQGAFGVVFRAEQTRPVKRIVAVKIIKPGMDSREVVTRFEAERQALAVMNHPHIAKVYDAGTTERGRPYFVMEYVEGAPLTKFCDAHELGMRERLELFAALCEAVQHAHQKGIIHRDLKPGNILVSMDGEGVVTPKVIDFGVAKAVNMELTDKTFFTVFGQMMGTPQYMSPEQTDLNAVDVDTRSDIYSLGVLLYELVTGVVPIGNEKLTSAGFDEMRRMIREEQPARPSVRVAGLDADELKKGAEARGIECGRLRRYLEGDLDWVAMKALEKDRARRYETAQGLANDVRNFLEGQPVTAGPPGAAYRVRKFVGRHRAGVLATVLILGALVAMLVVANKERVAADEASVAAQEARAAEEREKNRKEYQRLKLLVEGVWNWREAQPGSRGRAFVALEEVGTYALESIGLNDDEIRELRDDARDALFACMLWVDLEEEVLRNGLGASWPLAAMDEGWEKLALATGDGRVEVQEVASGEKLQEWVPEDRGAKRFLRMSPDGKLVAVAVGDDRGWSVEVRDLSAAVTIAPDVRGVGTAFDFLPGGAGFAVGTSSGTVEFFGPDGQGTNQLQLDGAVEAHAIRVSPTGLATAIAFRRGGLEVRGEERHAWPQLATQRFTSLAWSPDGKSLIAGCGEGSVMVMGLAGTTVETMEQRHGGPVEQVAWSRDGRLMASSSRDEVWLWDGRQRIKVTEFSAWARSLAFSADGEALGPVTPDEDEEALAVLRVKRSKACAAVAGHSGEQIKASTWLFNGGVLVTGAADGLRFWNREGRALLHLPDIVVQPGGMLAAGSEPEEGGSDLLFLAESDGIYRLQLSVTDGRLQTGQHTLFSPVTGGERLALSKDGMLLAVAHDKEVVLVNGKSGDPIGEPLASPAGTAFVSISPDPANTWLAAGTRGGTGVRLWRVDGLREAGGAVAPPIDLPVDGSAMVAFFPQTERKGQQFPPMLVTGDDRAYRLWVLHPDLGWVQKVERENGMANPEGRVATLTFSPRGTVLVGSINRRYLRIMNPQDLSALSEPIFDRQWPLTVDSQGRRMATEATDGRLFIWDMAQARGELKNCGLDWPFREFDPDMAPLVLP